MTNRSSLSLASMFHFWPISLVIASWLALAVLTQAQAETMSSDSYQVTFGNFNVTSGEKSSASYNLTDTIGQIAPGQFSGTGYYVKSGFQYIYPFLTFSFKISSLTIDLGELTSGTFSTDYHTLIVDTQGAGGYSVTAMETHPLRLQHGSATIPDTTCDSGSCDETTAGEWIDATKTGFGFNANGDDVAADFTTSNYFRQFANQAGAESPQEIMSSNSLVTNRSATITYKVSMPGSQQAGLYETLIIYQAIPTY